jgi:hypothetical protein
MVMVIEVKAGTLLERRSLGTLSYTRMYTNRVFFLPIKQKCPFSLELNLQKNQLSQGVVKVARMVCNLLWYPSRPG